MGYWEEKREYEEQKLLHTGCVILNCTWCGAPLKLDKKNNRYKWINCQKFHILTKGTILCEKCAKKCKKCKRYFCPNHINNHRCIQCNPEEDSWECSNCKESFILNGNEAKLMLKQKGKISVKCPYCKKQQTCYE